MIINEINNQSLQGCLNEAHPRQSWFSWIVTRPSEVNAFIKELPTKIANMLAAYAYEEKHSQEADEWLSPERVVLLIVEDQAPETSLESDSPDEAVNEPETLLEAAEESIPTEKQIKEQIVKLAHTITEKISKNLVDQATIKLTGEPASHEGRFIRAFDSLVCCMIEQGSQGIIALIYQQIREQLLQHSVDEQMKGVESVLSNYNSALESIVKDESINKELKRIKENLNNQKKSIIEAVKNFYEESIINSNFSKDLKQNLVREMKKETEKQLKFHEELANEKINEILTNELNKPKYNDGIPPKASYDEIVKELVKKYYKNISLSKIINDKLMKRGIFVLPEGILQDGILKDIVSIFLDCLEYFIKRILFLVSIVTRIILLLPEYFLNRWLPGFIEKSLIENEVFNNLWKQALDQISTQRGLSSSVLETLNDLLQDLKKRLAAQQGGFKEIRKRLERIGKEHALSDPVFKDLISLLNNVNTQIERDPTEVERRNFEELLEQRLKGISAQNRLPDPVLEKLTAFFKEAITQIEKSHPVAKGGIFETLLQHELRNISRKYELSDLAVKDLSGFFKEAILEIEKSYAATHLDIPGVNWKNAIKKINEQKDPKTIILNLEKVLEQISKQYNIPAKELTSLFESGIVRIKINHLLNQHVNLLLKSSDAYRDVAKLEKPRNPPGLFQQYVKGKIKEGIEAGTKDLFSQIWEQVMDENFINKKCYTLITKLHNSLSSPDYIENNNYEELQKRFCQLLRGVLELLIDDKLQSFYIGEGEFRTSTITRVDEIINESVNAFSSPAFVKFAGDAVLRRFLPNQS